MVRSMEHKFNKSLSTRPSTLELWKSTILIIKQSYNISLTAPSPTEKFRILELTMVVSNKSVVSSGDADHLQWLALVACQLPV